MTRNLFYIPCWTYFEVGGRHNWAADVTCPEGFITLERATEFLKKNKNPHGKAGAGSFILREWR